MTLGRPALARPALARPVLARAGLDRAGLDRAGLDRAAHLRGDPAVLDRLWSDPRARVLQVADGRALVAGDPPSLVVVPPVAVPTSPGRERYLLGLDADGGPWFAVPVDALDPAGSDGARAAGLREVGALLDDRDAGALVHAVALTGWHTSHPRCPRCGTPTEVVAGGAQRRCPADGSSHFPRSDPAVIMAVVDRAAGDVEGEQLLLGRQGGWPEARFSTLAGFVEPGESCEAAVRREVAEEAGVAVGEVRYLGSQPWPFPSSLMLGFEADLRGPRDAARPDGEEIAQLRWYSRAALRADFGSGRLRLPPRVSIARRLVEHWYGEKLPPP